MEKYIYHDMDHAKRKSGFFRRVRNFFKRKSLEAKVGLGLAIGAATLAIASYAPRDLTSKQPQQVISQSSPTSRPYQSFFDSENISKENIQDILPRSSYPKILVPSTQKEPLGKKPASPNKQDILNSFRNFWEKELELKNFQEAMQELDEETLDIIISLENLKQEAENERLERYLEKSIREIKLKDTLQSRYIQRVVENVDALPITLDSYEKIIAKSITFNELLEFNKLVYSSKIILSMLRNYDNKFDEESWKNFYESGKDIERLYDKKAPKEYFKKIEKKYQVVPDIPLS